MGSVNVFQDRHGSITRCLLDMECVAILHDVDMENILFC